MAAEPNTANDSKQQVITYMRQCVQNGEHLDCEVECTRLAEDAAEHFNAYGPEPHCEIPEAFFAWSFEVAQWYERQPHG